MWVSDNLVNNPQIIFGCLCPTFVCHYCRRAHTGKNRSANPSVPLETTTNNSKPFRQGLWSHLLHQLILVGAAAYWQLSHLLPANVRDALAGHDELQDVHAQQGLDAGLAATALHSGTPSCPPILVRRTEAAVEL